eukprot:SAG11_NODE_1495_length_4799_cov_1881.608723_3_plen_522_part_00
MVKETGYNTIEYYENGTQDQKESADDWLEKLNETYNINKNKVGAKKLYQVLKLLYPEDNKHPTKRFVNDYLRRQGDHQINKETKKKADVIGSIVANRPNSHLQVDYCYFFWSADGVEDERGEGPVDEEDKSQRQRKVEVDKLFKDKKLLIRGVIVAIDVFSKYGYVRKIKGNINSEKAKEAMESILEEANEKFKKFGKIIIIQTDKGSEFQGTTSNQFKPYLKKLSEDNPGFYKHYFGYSGRSQSQGMVERLNKTIKSMTMKALQGNLTTNWVETLTKYIIKNYNTNYHSTIQTSPEKIRDLTKDGPEIKEIKERILKKAIKNKVDLGIYKPGDYVRLKRYKATKLEPSFTFKGGPLVNMAEEDDAEDFEGVYMIHSVLKATNSDTSPARATRYRIVANWEKESKVESVPGGQKGAKEGKRIKVSESIYFNEMSYPKGAYGRNFVKHALSRVPMDKDGKAIVEFDDDEEYVVQAILGERLNDDKQKEYEVQWKGYDETTWEPKKNIMRARAFEKYEKNKKK